MKIKNNLLGRGVYVVRFLVTLLLLPFTIFFALSPKKLDSFLFDFSYFPTPVSSDAAIRSDITNDVILEINMEKKSSTYHTSICLLGVGISQVR